MNLARRSLTRCLTTNAPSPADQTTIRDQLRALLRETAQPVAVITSALHSVPPTDDAPAAFHGATLSSFTSVALDPFPLITFSLRIPSRMAASLNSAPSHHPSHMVINILSAAQASAAIAFSRPDLYREPFASVPYFLSEDRVPILEGSLGALSCRLVARSLPLHDLDILRNGLADAEAERRMPGAEVMASELFIARVVRVERARRGDGHESNALYQLPLLYHRKVFTSCDTQHQGLGLTGCGTS